MSLLGARLAGIMLASVRGCRAKSEELCGFGSRKGAPFILILGMFPWFSSDLAQSGAHGVRVPGRRQMRGGVMSIKIGRREKKKIGKSTSIYESTVCKRKRRTSPGKC